MGLGYLFENIEVRQELKEMQICLHLKSTVK